MLFYWRVSVAVGGWCLPVGCCLRYLCYGCLFGLLWFVFAFGLVVICVGFADLLR